MAECKGHRDHHETCFHICSVGSTYRCRLEFGYFLPEIDQFCPKKSPFFSQKYIFLTKIDYFCSVEIFFRSKHVFSLKIFFFGQNNLFWSNLLKTKTKIEKK